MEGLQQRYVAVVELDTPGVVESSYSGPVGPTYAPAGPTPSPYVPAGPPPPPAPAPPAPPSISSSIPPAPMRPQPVPYRPVSQTGPPQPQPGDYSTWNGNQNQGNQNQGNPVQVNVQGNNQHPTGPGDYSTWNGTQQQCVAPHGPVSVNTNVQPTMNYHGHLGSSIYGPLLIGDGDAPELGNLRSSSSRYHSEPEYLGTNEPGYVSRVIPAHLLRNDGKRSSDRSSNRNQGEQGLMIGRIVPQREPIYRPRDDVRRVSKRSYDRQSQASKARSVDKHHHTPIPNGLHNMVQLDINMTGSKTMTLGTSGNDHGDIVVDGDVGKTGHHATITWGTIDEKDETNKSKDLGEDDKRLFGNDGDKRPRNLIFGVVLCILLVLLVIAFIVVLVILFAR